MTGGTDNRQAAQFRYCIVVNFVSTAQLNIGAASGHLGRDGDASNIAGLGDDLCFLLIVFSVEHIDVDAALAQRIRHIFRLGNILRAHQDGLARGVNGGNFFHDCGGFVIDRRKNAVLLIKALQGFIAVDHGYMKIIELPQLIGRLHRGTRHAAHKWITPHKFLQRDGVEDAPAFGNL